MTEQEAINGLEMDIETFITDRCCSDAEEEEVRQELRIVKNAFEEVQQYRALGSVEELKEAKEKQISKKPLLIKRSFSQFYICPNCSDKENYKALWSETDYCHRCGQRLDWSEI